MTQKILILMIAFATVELNVTGSWLTERKRWKNARNNSPYVNICDITDRESKVHCYCESIKLKTATKADCWVFNGGIAEDDPFWSNFYSQPRIEKLTFNIRADGGLTYIPAKVIVRLEHIRYLNIQYAHIFSIPAFVFTNSTTLKEITLPKNKIATLEKMSFANLITLSNVSLAENQISELKADVFYMLPNLQRLTLSKNLIAILHDGCFKHLSSLVRLDLDNNLLTVIIRENFEGLSNLITLDLRKNKLNMIGDLALAELWSLQELYLDANEIEYISGRAFRGLNQMRKLSLVDNKLSALDDGVLNDNLRMNTLDLRNNNFETLRQETVQNVLENMKTSNALISLEGNKLICDCRLSWVHKLKNETRSKRLKAHLNRLVCIMDEQFQTQMDTVKISQVNNFNKKDDDEAFEDEKSYDYTTKDADTKSDVSKVEYRKKLTDIPVEMLPCSSRLNEEAIYAPPNQDEVKYYKTSSSSIVVSTVSITAISLMCVVL